MIMIILPSKKTVDRRMNKKTLLDTLSTKYGFEDLASQREKLAHQQI